MPDFVINGFKYGLDTRKDVLSSQPGTLVTCENAYVNAGGEIEKRKQFAEAYDVSVFDDDALAVTITRSGSTATATLTAHGLAVGDQVTIAGATQPEYNGIQTITAVTANTFSYTVSGTPATPATGSPTVSFVGTFGIEVTSDGIVVFGSATVFGGTGVTGEPNLASALPAGVTYAQLRHPGVGQYQDPDETLYDYRYHRMTGIVFSVNFNGDYFVAAEFVDGRTFLYYNSSVAISDSWDGIVLEVPNSNFTMPQVAAINLVRELEEFGWSAATTDEDDSTQEGTFAMVKSPAGDFYSIQIETDTTDGQVGSNLKSTDGAATPGTRSVCAIRVATNGTVQLISELVSSLSDQANLTGGVISAGATAAATAAKVVQAINDYTSLHGYQAVVSSDVIIIFAPPDQALTSTPLQIDDTGGTAVLSSATGSTNAVVGYVVSSPLEVVREVPMPGEAWPVSGEVQVYAFGGVPPYTFEWSELSPGTGNGINFEDADDPSTSFSKNLKENSEVTGQFKCNISAQGGGVGTTVYITVTLKAVYTSGQ